MKKENQNNNVVYAPLILRSLVEICAHTGVGRETVFEWIDKGAPIAVEYNGKKPRYSCEAAHLMQWRVDQGKLQEKAG